MTVDTELKLRIYQPQLIRLKWLGRFGSIRAAVLARSARGHSPRRSKFNWFNAR